MDLFVNTDKPVEEAPLVLVTLALGIADPFIQADEQVEQAAIGLGFTGSTHLLGVRVR